MTTVVLVPGAWTGSWEWEPLIQELGPHGISARAVDLPSIGAADASVTPLDDAAAVRAVLDEASSDKLVVANSYGGIVVAAAAHDRRDVRHLVYLAAHLPRPGEAVLDVLIGCGTEEFGKGIEILPDGRVALDPEVALRCAHNRASDEVKAFVQQHQARLMSYGTDPTLALDAVAWQEIPTTYVVCAADNVIRPDVQREWASEVQFSEEWDADHVPQLSNPQRVAGLIQRLVA
ncbi:MAG TPA: alpha/beta hydrolase [Actinomycetota bacterium]|jgi:pimeloyl-ACP methyl ester carboxylesterase|nr:alpha/beta hydrolase [Actinomycetota bacterium]